MALTSVQYWDQMEVAFCMLLAIIASAPSYTADTPETDTVYSEIDSPIRQPQYLRLLSQER